MLPRFFAILPFVSVIALISTSAIQAQTPAPTIEIREDFSSCDFDSDKVVDRVVKNGKKITIRFSKSKRKQTILLDKAYLFFKCVRVKKQTTLLAKRHSRDAWAVVNVPSSEGLGRVCPKIVSLGYRQLYKYSASGHLASTDRARACSFIGGKGAAVPSANSLPLYDKNGGSLSVFRAYAKHGNIYSFRFYTYSPPCSQIAGTAKARTGSSEAYISLGGGSCIKITNLYGREGGVQ